MKRDVHHGGGSIRNRECAACVSSCTAGEVLHRKGPCCRCVCEGFVEKRNHFAVPSLTNALAHRVKVQPRRFLDQGRVEA